MRFPDKHKIQRISFWAAVIIIFAAPIETFHFILESLHLLFEGVEASLDFIIELIFETSLETTQISVFYIIMAGILYGLYRLWKGLPYFYSRQKAKLSAFLSDEIEFVLHYWRESVLSKINLLCAASGLVFLLFA